MNAIGNIFVTAFNDIKTMSFTDFLDIIIVAYLIYKVIGFVRKTNSYNLAKGIVFILIALGLSYVLQLTMINFLLRKTVELGLIALVVLFQPELRRLLERMGRGFSSRRTLSTPIMEDAITQTVIACTEMSSSHTGALLIGTYDRFTYGDPAGFLKNINDHMPTAKRNKLIFIEKTGHTYQQKEQEVADRLLGLVKEWEEERICLSSPAR